MSRCATSVAIATSPSDRTVPTTSGGSSSAEPGVLRRVVGAFRLVITDRASVGGRLALDLEALPVQDLPLVVRDGRAT